MFESRLVAQSSFGDNTSGFAGVTQLVERRLLSDPIGVRVLSPAPIIPRWRNGKRSGPRPRGPFRPWEFDSPSRDHLTVSGAWPEVEGYRSARTYRCKPASLTNNTPGHYVLSEAAFGPESFGYRSKRWGGGRVSGPGFDSRQAMPRSEDTTRPNALRQSAPSRMLRVIAVNDVAACSNPAGSMRSVAQW